MSENKKFVSYNINSAFDVETVEAGLAPQVQKAGAGYVEAVQALVKASLSGDLEAAAVAKSKISQYADQLEALGQTKAELNAYAQTPGEPAPEPAFKSVSSRKLS